MLEVVFIFGYVDYDYRSLVKICLHTISFSDSRSQHVKKITGELIWKMKVSLPEGKWQNFWQKQFTLVQEVLQSPKYSTMMCE